MLALARVSTLPLITCSLLAACTQQPSDEPFDGSNGKADTASVASALERVTADGDLSVDDIDELFSEMGGRVSKNEILLVRDAVESTDWTVSDEAFNHASERAYFANLFEYETEQLADPSLGYGGIEIPEAVRALVAQAKLNGAVAFDVRDTKSDGEGRWSPYPATTPPTGNMAFDYTVITPQVLADDAADTQAVYNAIVGSESVEECNAFGNCQTFEQASYVERTGGTGTIAAHYDEVHHPDLFARGSRGQKWSSNCAFLSDGTIHCLPAPRRSDQRDFILTNPHLSRCSRFSQFAQDCHTMLYMGHITASNGVITDIEVSGRVSKRIAKGDDNLIDPIALLDAWGFERQSTLRVRFGNTDDGVPATNGERGVLEAP